MGDTTLERLFTSRVRVQLLAHFLLHPGEEYHIRSIASQIDAQYSAVWKELNNLEEIGLLASESTSGRKTYWLKPDFPLVPDLRNLILKTLGMEEAIRQSLQEGKDIQTALIFGSFASGEPDAQSDLDLLIIGEPVLADLEAMLSDIEAKLGREINTILLSREEWVDRLNEKDPLALNIRNSPKIMILGEEDVL